MHSKRVVEGGGGGGGGGSGWRMRGEGRREKIGVDKRMSESEAKYV